MKKIFTFKKSKLAIFSLLLLMAGCYQLNYIIHPDAAETNSSFDVTIGLKQQDGGDYTGDSVALTDTAMLGILIPNGWTVNDSIHYFKTADSAQYNYDGYIVKNDWYVPQLEDSIPAPDNYYWWGGSAIVNMQMFDSLKFTITINTDDQVGTFDLKYVIGDKNAKTDHARDPYGVLVEKSITISAPEPNGVKMTEAATDFDIYPNPSTGIFNIRNDQENQGVVKLNVYNEAGKIIYSKNEAAINSRIDLTQYPKGIYFITIESNSKIESRKIIIM